MYKNQRRIKELTPYIPAADIFRIYEREPGAAFLDSSLVNELGHYSVIGRCPYLKLVKDGETFTINGRPETETTFEDYMREYLNTHEDKNSSGLPIVSGAVGYFSYDYGRKQMGVPSGEKDLVTVPEAVLTFYDCFIVEDCQEKRTYLVSNGISADAAAEIGAMEKAIREFTELGSGFKIAMRDLEIRGAGNLLGAEQHGHMEAVGYDLYCKMLNEAVKQEKGEMDEDMFNTTIDLNVDAYIPDSYISNEFQKLDIYKRIASIENEEEMDDMLEELIDRFGDVPRKVQQLLHIALLKALAHSVYVTAVEQKTETIKITMYEKAKVDPKKIPGLLEAYHGNLVLKAETTPYFLYQKKGKNKKEKSEDILELVKKLLNDIKTLLEI